MDIKKVADYKSAIYNNEEFEKIAIWSELARGLIAYGPKLRNLGTSVMKGGIGAYNSVVGGGIGAKAAKGAVLGAAAGAMKNNKDNNDGTFGNSVFGSMAKGALGGAATGAAIGVAAKGLKIKPISKSPTPPAPSPAPSSDALTTNASEWIDEAFEKIAVLVPGTPQWIKQKDRSKKKMKKLAFIGGEDSTSNPKHKNDPYRTTKTVGGVELANHALNLATDVGAAGLAATGGFKGVRSAMKGQGLKQGLKSAISSPEFKKDMATTLKSQKYILPIGAAISAGYLAKAYHDDKKHNQLQQTTSGPEAAQQQLNKTASNESREDTVKVWGKRSILEDDRPDSKYDPKELAIGLRIEHEHTRKVLPYDQATFIAAKIAKDHLDEFPDYYTRLEKLEEQAAKAKKAKKVKR